MRRLFPAAALLSLALAACGSRPVAITALGENAAPVETTPAPRVAAADPGRRAAFTPLQTEPARPGTDGARRGTGSKKTPADYWGAADFNTMPLDVTLSASCVEPGGQMSATAETLESSKLAFAASYSDNDFVPNFTYVPAEGNPTGTFTWTWTTTPTTPRGDAMVTVVASKGQKGASFRARFVVAEQC